MNTKTIKLLLALTVAAMPVAGLQLAEKSPKTAATDQVDRGKSFVNHGSSSDRHLPPKITNYGSAPTDR